MAPVRRFVPPGWFNSIRGLYLAALLLFTGNAF
jgi:hypothetical protein